MVREGETVRLPDDETAEPFNVREYAWLLVHDNTVD
jgi:hypothetical protein